MCSSKAKVTTGVEITTPPTVARINGRPVLQPTCNRVPTLDRLNSLKKIPPLSPPLASTPSATIGNGSRVIALITPPLSPKSPGLQEYAIKPNNAFNSSSCDEKVVTHPRKLATKTLERKKSKSFKESILGNGFSSSSSSSSSSCVEPSTTYSSSLMFEAPGSIAAVRREQMALQQAQRKMKIAHYGRSKSAKFESNDKVVPLVIDTSSSVVSTKSGDQVKRCNFITPNSDPIYVAYHDEEWGAPIHDDSKLFELLVLSGAQVGSDWTTILKKRQDFRDAFAGFVAETVANFSEKQMTTICSEYGIEISKVRGVVDNSKRILEVKAEFGSFDKYIWGFVNHKTILTQYKFGHKIPVKTSKSESISKDMVRRGFRFVGPTVVHSFMQAAGLTNDHLITCHRHLPCALLAVQKQPLQSPLTV